MLKLRLRQRLRLRKTDLIIIEFDGSKVNESFSVIITEN
jgi:hypothetical protein